MIRARKAKEDAEAAERVHVSFPLGPDPAMTGLEREIASLKADKAQLVRDLAAEKENLGRRAVESSPSQLRNQGQAALCPLLSLQFLSQDRPWLGRVQLVRL